MTSVERIKEYSEIDSENLNQGNVKPPSDWPKNGRIIFNNVSFRYDKNLPNVLNDLTLNVNPGEKIGIVGRTGKIL
jgi:ABC-type multidrug transport system fused ATPase/permease subunit